VERQYLQDAYRYDPIRGWKRMADLPYSVAAAPTPAPVDHSGFYVLGGDDGTQIDLPPDAHRGFNKTILKYDLKTESWVASGEVAEPRVTVACVPWNKSWVMTSGEARPGIRSPEVWSFVPGKKE
jgi:N-acetylneuraminate epimerase